MTTQEKLTAAAESNPRINVSVLKNGEVKQHFTLVKDVQVPGNCYLNVPGDFYLQGLAADSHPLSFFATILNGAESKGYQVEVLGR